MRHEMHLGKMIKWHISWHALTQRGKGGEERSVKIHPLASRADRETVTVRVGIHHLG